MYLTAQRVRSGTRTGINVLLYRHPPGLPIAWADPVIVVEQDPGELVSAQIEVPPGGNAVLSYLDIVAEESVRSEQVVEHLEGLRGTVLRDGLASVHGVGLRFTVLAGSVASPEPEYRELVQRAVALLLRPPLLPWRSGEGLTILQQENEERLQFTLAPRSTAKLRETLGERWQPPSVTVSQSTMADLRHSGFDAYEQIATAMTGYRLDELLPLGQVRFEDGFDVVIWEWPARAQGIGYCLNCHRQHTLVSADGGYRCTNCDALQGNDGRFVATLH